MVAALMTTNGPSARAELAWIMRAASSLPQPDGPTIRMRLLVGDTRSMVWRRLLIAGEEPINCWACDDSCFSACTSRLSRNISSARLVTTTRRSALNGFSMKS